MKNSSPNFGQMTCQSDSQQKKRNCRFVYFAVPGDCKVKLKESEKDKYQGHARGLKKTVEHESNGYTYCNWSITVTKELVPRLEGLEIGGRVETI